MGLKIQPSGWQPGNLLEVVLGSIPDLLNKKRQEWEPIVWVQRDLQVILVQAKVKELLLSSN